MPQAIGPDVPPEDVDLVQDMPVLAATGRRLGILEEARCPGTEHVAQWLIVRRGLIDRRVIGNPRVLGERSGGLLTDLTVKAWATLPPAMSDDDLRERVEGALHEAGDPAESFLRTLTARVEAQRVFLQGYLQNHDRELEAVRRIRGVEGVLDVQTSIVTDAELEAAVTRALGTDLRTRGMTIRVRAMLGRVDLLGQVLNREAASSAEGVAAGVPGVLAVHTYLALARPPKQSDTADPRAVSEA